MPTMIEMRMNSGSGVTQTSDPVDQSSHASSPTHFNAPSTGTEVVFALGFLMVAIYGVKVLGRVIKRAE